MGEIRRIRRAYATREQAADDALAQRTWPVPLDQLEDGACAVASDGRILTANRSFCGMTGFSETELAGEAEPAARTEIEQLRWDIKSLATAGAGLYALRLHCADGSMLPVAVNVAEISEPGEIGRAYFVLVRDCSRNATAWSEAVRPRGERQRPTFVAVIDADGEVIASSDWNVRPVDPAEDRFAQARYRKSLEESSEFLRAVTAGMGDGVFTIDAAGLVTYVNPAAERMLRWRSDELVGRRASEALGVELGANADTAQRPAERIEDASFRCGAGPPLPVSYVCSEFRGSDGVAGTVVMFSDITERRATQRRLERQAAEAGVLRRVTEALADERFVLYAQPIVEVESGRAVQNELLIRMLDESGDLVPPRDFLPVAERHGVIAAIDRWVITQAAQLIAAGNRVEINLSARSIADPNLATLIADEFDRVGADLAQLVVEVTETAVLANESAAKQFLEQMTALGSRVALDDFGTGYGTFTYLKHLTVHYLKIDLEFVRDLETSAASRNVVHAIANLARSFGMTAIAEGVEDARVVELLRELGVEQMQGFHIARPAPLDQVFEMPRDTPRPAPSTEAAQPNAATAAPEPAATSAPGDPADEALALARQAFDQPRIARRRARSASRRGDGGKRG